MERDRLAEQRKFEDMKDNNRIKQIQVEGENRIKEAKLKGDIEANIKCLNNEAQAQSQKYNQEVLKIQNNTLRINKVYELRQKQEQYSNEQRQKQLSNEKKKQGEIALNNKKESDKHEETMFKMKNDNQLNTLKVQEEYKLKGKEADNKQEI